MTKPAIRAQERQAEAAEAFRLGRHAAARDGFDQARRMFVEALGVDAPETLEALSDFGAACAVLGEHGAARTAHETVLAARRRVLGSAHPGVGTSLHNLGTVLRAQGEITAAEACHVESLQIWQAALGDAHPVLAKSLAALGALARDRSDAPAALHYAEHSLALRRRNGPDTGPHMALAYDDLACAYAMAGDDAAAKTWFAAAVKAAPDLAIARHHLAACLARLGETDDAARQRSLALARQSVFVQKAAQSQAPAVLIPSVSDDGNVPLEHILPQRDFTRIWWFPGRDAAAVLPHFDLVFNGIGDPDMVGDAATALADFLRDNQKPVFNHPDTVARTRRDLLPQRLAGIAGLVVPLVARLSAANRDIPPGLVAPFLLRPAGSHGGAGLQRLENSAELARVSLSAASIWYLSSFIDSRGRDGFFRKYRMAFVDRRPYPYHVAISPDWLVHYFSADMQAHDWKLAEEAAFLADPRSTLGIQAYDAIAEAAARLDLDFCGIDFTVLPDGRALVFEANATMLIHPESEQGKLAFKNSAVRDITRAVGKMFFSEEKNQKTFIS